MKTMSSSRRLHSPEFGGWKWVITIGSECHKDIRHIFMSCHLFSLFRLFFCVDWDSWESDEEICFLPVEQSLCVFVFFSVCPPRYDLSDLIRHTLNYIYLKTVLTILETTFLTLFHPLCFRPPDRRRRDVFGLANDTLLHGGVGRGNITLDPGDNSTDGIPPIREYPFSDEKTSAEYLEIPNLRPFTVYRIDIHACNEQVGRCSAGAFVFSRTKPAGKKVTWIQPMIEMWHSVLEPLLLQGMVDTCLSCLCVSQSKQMTSLERWSMRGVRKSKVVWCCTGRSPSCPTVSSWCMRSSSVRGQRWARLGTVKPPLRHVSRHLKMLRYSPASADSSVKLCTDNILHCDTQTANEARHIILQSETFKLIDLQVRMLTPFF